MDEVGLTKHAEGAMDEDAFQVAKDEIDRAIDADIAGNLGIAMSFKLAGQFLGRGLLNIVRFQMLGEWDTRTYRDRYVFPDPWLDEAEFRLGSVKGPLD
jgi:hypothetical protein